MCKLCDKIWSSKEQYRDNLNSHWDEDIVLVKEAKYDGQIGLYVPCDDYFYSGTVMQCNYCPKCGKKLN